MYEGERDTVQNFRTVDINFLDIVALLSGSWQLMPRSILSHYALSGIFYVYMKFENIFLHGRFVVCNTAVE